MALEVKPKLNSNHKKKIVQMELSLRILFGIFTSVLMFVNMYRVFLKEGG